MAKHIGIVGCSAEGAALCYRTICEEAQVSMGEYMHPEVSMHTYPLGSYMVHIRSGNWKGVAGLMLSSVKKLASIGAEIAISPDNTIHQAFHTVEKESPIPWIHIAEAVSEEAKVRGFKKLGLLGTRYLMRGPVYPEVLTKYGMETILPGDDEMESINSIIFRELVNGIFSEKSRLYFNEVIENLKKKGAEAVILGCTEIPLLVDPNDCPLPVLDSTRLLARSALRRSIGE